MQRGTKLRRAHKKSRYGCLVCKRRHVKCDERRPLCVNCSTAELQCSYSEKRSSPACSPTPGFTNSPHPTPSPATYLNSASDSPTLPQSSHQCAVNMHHMELFAHFLTVTANSLSETQKFTQPSLHFIVKHVVTTPYLMYEILAIAASHLGHLNPAQQQSYWDESASLQTQALSLFNNDPFDVQADNCVSKLLFSSFLGIHVLFNAVSSSDGDADLLNKFIAHLDIHRGVHAIATKSWSMLRQTELEPILRAAETSLQPQAEESQECDGLRSLFDSSDLDSSLVTECQDAIRHLQGLFGAERSLREQEVRSDVVFAWPIIISGEYTKLLLRRRPEALVILAHYAVLLHARRHIWVVGDAGRALIESITLHLGTYWKQWLAWPNEMLAMGTTPIC